LIDLCTEVIYNIDDRGYLLYSLDEIHQALAADWTREAEKARAGSTPTSGPASAPAAAPVVPGNGSEDVGILTKLRPAARREPPPRELLQRALSIVQGLDPPGVGGRDLKECLLLQLRRDGQPYPIETRIIEDHLDDLGANRLPKIAKALGVPVEEVKAAGETIASLNPIPGKLFGGGRTSYVRPDVVVDEVDGRYEVRVESGQLPRLQVSSYYRDLYRGAGKDPELKKFVKKKLESAEWLIAAIRQRQSTLLRIAQEIVEIQKDFLDHGISHLKPLKMVEVAERVGVHVSTISRALSGKYIQTPRGIFEMKSFFTGGALKDDGTMEARGSLIQRIKELVGGEDKRSPLSDIDIVKKLEQSGIRISRRTVTKYREAENIPSSRQRRAY
ncbi:MAG: RNA polymerase factor sigma-54, partial [Thermoanaerobaculia bacterium]